MAWTRRGGMYYAPSSLDPYIPMITRGQGSAGIRVRQYVGGEWRHFPINTAWDAFKGANYATSIAQGNFMTRNYRQKGFLNSPLETATHKKKPTVKELRKKVLKAIDNRVAIPTVSSRRVKDYSQNNLLPKSTTMYRPKRPNPFVKKASSGKKTTKKKATNRQNKKRFPAKAKSATKVLKAEVNKLKKAINVDKATHVFKQADASAHKSLLGRCNHTAFAVSAKAELENACANLRYYDPAVPGTLVTADASTGTYARDVHFKDYYVKLNIRNNYQVPAKVKVYLCRVKNDCNETPLTTYTTAIADQVITAGVDETDQLIYLNDIERVREVWNVDCVIDRVLEPGQEATTSYSTGSFNFDPSHLDSFTNAYQQVFKGSAYVIRVEGVLGHDTAITTEQSLLQAGVDFEVIRKAVIEYDAGVALNDIFIDENRPQVFTNGGVASLKPVADNIAYSIP